MNLGAEDIFADPSHARACFSYRRPIEAVVSRYLAELDALLVASTSSQPLVIDAGCGAGAFTIPLARLAHAHGGHVLAIDTSPAMVDMAQRVVAQGQAQQLIAFQHGDVLTTDLPARCSLLWASDVIHLMADIHVFARSVFRLLERGGAIAIRMSSHSQLASYEWGSFFPDALKVDLERHHDTDAVRDALERNGFGDIAVKEIDESRRIPADSYLRLFESRCLSSLRLIQENRFAQGMADLRLACRGNAWMLRHARTTFVSARAA